MHCWQRRRLQCRKSQSQWHRTFLRRTPTHRRRHRSMHRRRMLPPGQAAQHHRAARSQSTPSRHNPSLHPIPMSSPTGRDRSLWPSPVCLRRLTSTQAKQINNSMACNITDTFTNFEQSHVAASHLLFTAHSTSTATLWPFHLGMWQSSWKFAFVECKFWCTNPYKCKCEYWKKN